MRKNLVLTIFFSIFLCIMACQGGSNGGNVAPIISADNPVTDPVDPIDPTTPDDPEPCTEDMAGCTPADPNIPETKPVEGIARFFYNQNVIDLLADGTMKQQFQASNYAISKDGTFEIKDGTAFVNSEELCTVNFTAKEVINNAGGYFAIDNSKNVYRLTTKGFELLCTGISDAFPPFVCDDGYSNGNYFWFFTSGKFEHMGGFTKSGDIVTLEEAVSGSNSEFFYVLKDGVFKYITVVDFSAFYRCPWFAVGDKIYSTRGAVIDTVGKDHKQPYFDNTIIPPAQTGFYTRGNDYIKYSNYPYRKSGMANNEYFHYIGKSDNVLYYLNAKRGEISKFFLDTEKEQAMSFIEGIGTAGNSNIMPNIAFFAKVNPIMIGNYIFYCDGTSIYKYNFKLSTTEKIADATSFKAWVK